MNSIGIVALGPIDPTVLQQITAGLVRTFFHPVTILDGLPEPTFAYDERRGQYSSVLVLRSLLERFSTSTVRLLGVTEKDLFIPMLSFVLGQAQLNGPLAVISLARLQQQFYGFPPDADLLVARAVKEAVHEVGHTFGLTHCADVRCPMSLSNNVRHVDAKGPTLCATCAGMLNEHFLHTRSGDGRPGAAGQGS
jgi:archaemetzincin